MPTRSGIIDPGTTTGRTTVGYTAKLLWWCSLRSAWTEARPAVQIIFQLRLLAIVAVASLESGVAPNALAVALCCSGWLCVTWSIYLLNGLSDLATDRVNGSTRPLAHGSLDPDFARILVFVLAATGSGLCYLAGEQVFLLSAAMLVLGFLYSAGPVPLKNTVCGVQASVVGGGFATYAAGVSAAGTGPSPAVFVFAIALSAWMGVGGFAKDLSDVDGDHAAGRFTLAIWSERGAHVVIAAVATTVAVSFLVASRFSNAGLVVPAAFLCAGATAMAVRAVAVRRHRWHARTSYHAFMYSQYGAHAGALCLVL